MIASCDVMVFFASQKSIRSPTCEEEIAYAREIGKRIIVVQVSKIDFSTAPPRIAAMNVKIDFSNHKLTLFQDAINTLTDALRVDLPWLREGKRLASKVQEWDSKKRPDELLLFGHEITNAEAWQTNRPINHPKPGSLLLNFISKSQELETRREEQRLKQIEQRERQIRRISFQQRIGAIGLIIFFLIVLITAFFTVKNMRSVGRAESDMIARSAQSALQSGDTQTALKLATLASRQGFFNPTTDFSRITLLNAAQSHSIEYIYSSDTGIKKVEYIEADELLIVDEEHPTQLNFRAQTKIRISDFSSKFIRFFEKPKIAENELGFLADARVFTSSDGNFTIKWENDRIEDHSFLTIIKNDTGDFLEKNFESPDCKWTGAKFSPDSQSVVLWMGGGNHWAASNNKCFESLDNGKNAVLLDLSKFDTRDAPTTILPTKFITNIEWSPDNKNLLASTYSDHLYLLNPNANTEIASDRFLNGIKGMVFSKNSKNYLVWGNQEVRLYDSLSAQSPIASLSEIEYINDAMFISDDKMIATWSNKELIVRRINGLGKKINLIANASTKQRIEKLVLNSTENHAAIIAEDNSLSLLDLSTGHFIELENIHDFNESPIFSLDGEWLFAFSNRLKDNYLPSNTTSVGFLNKRICRWSTSEGRLTGCYVIQDTFAKLISVAENGAWMHVAVSNEGLTHIKKIVFGHEIEQASIIGLPYSSRIKYLERGDGFLAIDTRETLNQISLTSERGEIVTPLNFMLYGSDEDFVPPKDYQTYAISENGKYLASTGNSGLTLYDIETQTVLLHEELGRVGLTGGVKRPIFSQDSKKLWFLGDGVESIDLKNESNHYETRSYGTASSFTLAYNDTAVVRYVAGKIFVNRVADGRELISFSVGDLLSSDEIVFLPKNNNFISWSNDGEIIVWSFKWLIPFLEGNRLRDDVCSSLFSSGKSPDFNQNEDHSTNHILQNDMSSPSTLINNSDIDLAPILSELQGSSVCKK